MVPAGQRQRRSERAGARRSLPYIERFNRSYRTEVLNAHFLESIGELRALTWLRIYNAHDSLGRVPPLMFLPRPSSAETSAICSHEISRASLLVLSGSP